MKTSLIKPTLALLAALLLVPLAFAESTGDVRDVRVVRSADQEARAAALGQPSIALWRKTHLVVAFQRNIAGKTDMGSIDAVVSGNDGESWSIPSTIFDHEQRHGAMQFGYCNAVLYKPPGQEVMWCFAMRCPLNYADSEDSHLAAASSGDGGRTWSVAHEEPDLWNTVSEAWFGQSQLGTQFYVYNDGLTFSRMALRYKLKPASGAWSEERTFFDAGIHNSYPTLIEIAPGEFRAVWDSGDAKSHRRSIRFGKLTLEQSP